MIDGYAYARLLRPLWRHRVRRGGLVLLLGRLLLSRLTPGTALSSWWPKAFARYLLGLDPGKLQPFAEEAARVVAAEVRPEMREAIAAERARGAEIWLVSATVDLLADAVTTAFGFDACVATRLAMAHGRYDGNLDGPVCRSGEKLRRVRARLGELGLDADWPACSYYADGYEDLPLLEAVGHPVAVRPDERLFAVATARGYRVVGPARGHRAGG